MSIEPLLLLYWDWDVRRAVLHQHGIRGFGDLGTGTGLLVASWRQRALKGETHLSTQRVWKLRPLSILRLFSLQYHGEGGAKLSPREANVRARAVTRLL